MFVVQLTLISLLVLGAHCETAERYMEYILGRHNGFRQRWFNGRQWERMEWDNSLAEEADRRMSECNMGNGYYRRGEHYAYYSGGDHYYNIRQTFDEWDNGMNGFDWRNNDGDFYQMDWYRGQSVGCAMHWCPSFFANGENYQNMWFFGCFYDQRDYNDNNEFFGGYNWDSNNLNSWNSDNNFNKGYYMNNDFYNNGFGNNDNLYYRGYYMNNDFYNNGYGNNDYYYNRDYYWNGNNDNGNFNYNRGYFYNGNNGDYNRGY
ncbi:uncharacterized protein DDB_G0280315-like [Mercenaria mercenaria]|uniref:uncharacterized protein DDB_G0280315-like n=1 Tax=Mercenaria mercenaria TaxID=6596 RepID=UPI00234F2A7E|nr:uncharacterized protein DDB_G0280315-like [Mercenaria mercenaria]